MLIGGAGLTLIGSAILIVEGRGERGAGASAPAAIAVIARHRRVYAAGGLLLGLSTFQAEFDFGVPQFQLVLEPIMLAFAAGVALVAARIWIGAGAALGAALFFVVVRGLLSLLVGDVFGGTMPHFPLYVAEALCVEGVALLVAPRTRPYVFGAAAGALIGTVGFAAEYTWSHVWMPYAWPQNLIGEAIIPVIVTAVAAGVLGGFLGTSFSAARDRRAAAAPALAPAVCALVAIVAALGLNVGDQAPPTDWSARVRLENATGGAERTVNATVRLDPPGLAAGADWFKRARLAGRRKARRRPARPGLARGVPDLGAAAGSRDVEDAVAPPARQHRRRPADLHARRQRDPGARREGEAELRAQLHRRDPDPPAGAEAGRAGLPRRPRLLGGRRDRRRLDPPPRMGPDADRARARRAPQAPPWRPGGADDPPAPRGDRMILPLAHMGHWLIGLGFASAPLTVIGGIVAIAIAERRRAERRRDH
jgi:hypothetical protein